MTAIIKSSKKADFAFQNQNGFSLVEVVVAMLVMIVLLLGTLTVFTYAVQYNRGSNLRSQALTVMQQEAEIYRSSKFVRSFTDTNLLGGTKATQTRTSVDNTVFNLDVSIDNDPSTSGIQSGETLASGKACTLKEIKITVTPQNGESNWIKAISANLTIQRVRGN